MARYATKRAALDVFRAANGHAMDAWSRPATGGEYDAVNERYGLRGMQRARTLADAAARCLKGRDLRALDLATLNETGPAREAGGLVLPPEIAEDMARESYNRGMSEMMEDDTMSDSAMARFALLDIDDDAPTVEPARTLPPGVDGAALARAERDARLAATIGIAAPTHNGLARDRLLYHAGTLADADAVQSSRQTWEKMPSLVTVGERYFDEIRAEKRCDFSARATDLTMASSGCLKVPAAGYLPTHDRALEGIASRLEIPGGGAYLPSIPASYRARLLNEIHFPGAGKRDLTMRVRERAADGFSGQPSIWSVVGSRYRTCDGDTIIRAALDRLPSDAKATVKYDGWTTSVDVLWHSPATEIGVGEVHKVGCRLRFADDGTASIKGDSLIHFARCLNLTVITRKTRRLARRHVGNGIVGVVDAALGRVAADVETFSGAWANARDEKAMDVYGYSSMADLFGALVASKRVWIAGVRAEDMTARLVSAWESDPGTSKAHVINAITRAAHENTWSSPWTTEALEETAGELVYQRVWMTNAAQLTV